MSDVLPKLVGSNIKKYLTENNLLLFSHYSNPNNLGGIDLNALEPRVRDALIEWILAINKPRLRKGQYPIVTYHILKNFPLFRMINIPYRTIK